MIISWCIHISKHQIIQLHAVFICQFKKMGKNKEQTMVCMIYQSKIVWVLKCSFTFFFFN